MNRLRRALSLSHNDDVMPKASKSTPTRSSQPPPSRPISGDITEPRRGLFGRKPSRDVSSDPSHKKIHIFGRRSREQERPVIIRSPPTPPHSTEDLLEKPTSPSSKSTIIRRKSSRRVINSSADSKELSKADMKNLSVEQQAEEYLQMGLECHERGELEKATAYWRISAEKENPLGLFFYGIALRHGWGCKANPPLAVTYLQKAAEHAVSELHASLTARTPPTIARGELTIAIYELGVSFRHGWGVPKNKSTAAYYFSIAAALGDADAQNDLAFCYLEGEGVKKDPAEAAHWFRKADKQGAGLVGNSWIWKEKYNETEDGDKARGILKEGKKGGNTKKEANVEKGKL